MGYLSCSNWCLAAICFRWELWQEARCTPFPTEMLVREHPQYGAHLRNSFGTQGREKLIFPWGTCMFSYQQREYHWMCLIVFPFPFFLWLPRSSEPNFWLNINSFMGPCGLHICIFSFLLVLTFYSVLCFPCSCLGAPAVTAGGSLVLFSSICLLSGDWIYGISAYDECLHSQEIWFSLNEAGSLPPCMVHLELQYFIIYSEPFERLSAHIPYMSPFNPHNCPRGRNSYLVQFIDEEWRRQWHPTLVLLPGKSHGWQSLVGSVVSDS